MGPRFDNPSILGLITSIFVLGCFFGMIPVAYAADFFGRRKTIQFGALIYTFGGALQTGARDMDYMLAGRFFSVEVGLGFGVGIMSDLAPLYQAEIAHPSIRGRLTTLQQILPALPLIAFILLLPESPRWLAEKGKFDEATAALARLHANGDVHDVFVLSQMEDIKADITKSKEDGAASWIELFNVPSNFRRLALGYILQFSVQMTGVSAIQYYSTTIFTTMGFDATRVLLFQSINSVIALIGEACCVLWVDSTGRRLPLIVGNVASGLSFVVGSILMARWPGTVDNDAETTGRRLEEMDALFGDSPLLIPGTQYAKAQNRHAAERELREGNFVPANLTERAEYKHDEEDKTASVELLEGR
ncbi:hypothetical protein VKT23_012399 [Stygiomarasmius scandens]|uniref:Major facilitator superfamily (MFS) profile domain-containing protein n=1 Tax=Marasmiellus scandens TaxID=2682957 RepID=A0ABR1J5Z3_9AGAR